MDLRQQVTVTTTSPKSKLEKSINKVSFNFQGRKYENFAPDTRPPWFVDNTGKVENTKQTSERLRKIHSISTSSIHQLYIKYSLTSV